MAALEVRERSERKLRRPFSSSIFLFPCAQQSYDYPKPGMQSNLTSGIWNRSDAR